jgi:hypothetical protein
MTSFSRRASSIACCLGLALTLPLAYAENAGVQAGATSELELHQFDFLVGRWEVSGEVKVGGLIALIHGTPKLAGTWKAWRAADGGIEDELKLTDASGNPAAALHSRRNFSRNENCWKISGRDDNSGNVPPATARWQGSEMLILSSDANQEGKRYQTRTHYDAITATSFRMVQDRSYDEGKTWEKGVVTLNAHRVNS